MIDFLPKISCNNIVTDGNEELKNPYMNRITRKTLSNKDKMLCTQKLMKSSKVLNCWKLMYENKLNQVPKLFGKKLL